MNARAKTVGEGGGWRAPTDEELRREIDHCVKFIEGRISYYDAPDVIWLDIGQDSFEAPWINPGTGVAVWCDLSKSVEESGYYFLTSCDPGCCPPVGPYPTLEAAKAVCESWADDERADRRVRLKYLISELAREN